MNQTCVNCACTATTRETNTKAENNELCMIGYPHNSSNRCQDPIKLKANMHRTGKEEGTGEVLFRTGNRIKGKENKRRRRKLKKKKSQKKMKKKQKKGKKQKKTNKKKRIKNKKGEKMEKRKTEEKQKKTQKYRKNGKKKKG